MPEGLNDHVVEFPEGFYDMQRWPVRIAAGTRMRVTKEQYMLMKGSDPSVTLVQVGPDPEVARRIFEAARKEKEADKAKEVKDWQPVGWYKAQLMKDPEIKEYFNNE